MAKNKVLDGRYLTIAVASMDSGDPVCDGDSGLHGVALIDTDADGNVVIDTQGVYDLSVKGIDDAGNVAVTIGDAIYWTSGDTPVLNKKRSGTFYGIALEAVVSAATTTIKVLVVNGNVDEEDRFKYRGALTLSTAGVATITGPGYYTLIPFGGAGSGADSLVTITGGKPGWEVVFESADGATDPITILDTGNINLPGTGHDLTANSKWSGMCSIGGDVDELDRMTYTAV